MSNDDNPPEGFLRIDWNRGQTNPNPTFNAHVGNFYMRKGAKGTPDALVMGLRVQSQMCNPAGGLHGGMMMTMADLVGSMVGTYVTGLRKFVPTVSMTFDFVAPAQIGAWVEGRCEVVKVTRTLLFTNIYLTVGAEKILRASGIYKIPSGEGQAFTRARLDRSAEVADPKVSVKGPPA